MTATVPHKPSRNHNKAHENYPPYDHHGFEINQFYMEAGNDEYADQLCLYGWLLGEQIGDEEVVCCIDEIVSKYMPEGKPLLRVAQYRARVSNAHQMTVLASMADCWEAITSGWIFRDLSRDENDAKCQHLEERPSPCSPMAPSRKTCLLRWPARSSGDDMASPLTVARNNYHKNPKATAIYTPPRSRQIPVRHLAQGWTIC